MTIWIHPGAEECFHIPNIVTGKHLEIEYQVNKPIKIKICFTFDPKLFYRSQLIKKKEEQKYQSERNLKETDFLENLEPSHTDRIIVFLSTELNCKV